MQEMQIGSRVVKEFDRPLIIAEMGANFNGDLGIAREMILRAKGAGVDVIKVQSWTKETTLVKKLYQGHDADIRDFGHEKLEDLLDFLALTENDHYVLKEYCDSNDIMFSSTPISFRHVDLLCDLDVPFLKIASMDLNHLPLIRYAAEKQKPLILSTGMGSLEEITRAVDTVHSTGNEQLILLHCTALYPPEDDEVNLNNIEYLREAFRCQVGYSDHTIGCSIPLASVAKGVSVIEKHYTLDKTLPGWDHKVSATPDEFGIIVEESKRISKALGSKVRIVGERELDKRNVFRRSIIVKSNLAKGSVITVDDLDFKRPGEGIPPDMLQFVVGRTLNSDVEADTLLNFEQFV